VRCLLAVGLPLAISACGQTSRSEFGTAIASPLVDASDDASLFSSFFDDVNTSCFSICPRTRAATLNLSCPSVVASVLTTGGCTAGLCPAKSRGPCAQALIPIESVQAGVCHVDLTLEGGFQYSTDVTFVQTTSQSGCPCTTIGPTQATFPVDNPNTTCADAGAAPGGDAGPDAGPAALTQDAGPDGAIVDGGPMLEAGADAIHE
jgi:hypothetical protein